MRTTGVRCAPVPAPRPKQLPNPPQPLPRTRFLQKAASEEHPDSPPNALSDVPPEPPAQGTLTVISQSLTPSAKKKTPPSKPPRSPGLKVSPSTSDAFPVTRRPGLMEVLTRPSPPAPPSSSHPRPASVTPPGRPAPEGRGRGFVAVPTRRAPRPRLAPLSLPPPPTSHPPRPLPGTAPPRLPPRPSPAQMAVSRSRAGAPEPRSAGLRLVSEPLCPVCSIEDFEDCCKEVFRNTRAAKDLASRGKHVQAASHYQVALTALDRVIRAQVLTLTQHEGTRQRLFLLQQDVFNLRKEALNGFTDAQTAVRAPRGLSPTRPTPGAPPSYDEVLNEDRRRQRDDPRQPSRQLSSQAAARAAFISHRRPPQGNQPPSLRPQSPANPTQLPATQQLAARVRPHSTIDSRVEELVGVLEPATSPSTIMPSRVAPQKPVRSSLIRPKSSYHPPSQPDQPMSLPPPLLPVSSPPPSLPTQQPQSPLPSLPPLPDEVLESQMKALQVCESTKGADVPASQPGEPLSLSAMPGNLQEEKKATKESGNDGGGNMMFLGDVAASGEGGGGGEVGGGGGGGGGGKNQAKITQSSVSSGIDPFLSLDPLASAKSQARGEQREGEQGGEGGKDQAKSSLPISSVSSIDDPFLRLDPFLPLESKAQDSDVFTEESPASHIPSTKTITQHSHSPAFSDDFTSTNTEQKKGSDSPTVTQRPASCIPFTNTDTQHSHSPAFSDDFTPSEAEQKTGPHSPAVMQSPLENLGNSILEALDFAITPTQGQRRVSPQSSRGRSYSEENLLDSSHNTLEAILNPNKGVYASRASIIEEFDPLAASQTELNNQNEEEEECNEKERKNDHQDKGGVRGAAPPIPVPRKTVYESAQAVKEQEGEEEEEEEFGSIYDSSPPNYYAEGGAIALEETTGVDDYDSYSTKRHPTADDDYDSYSTKRHPTADDDYDSYPAKRHPEAQYSFDGARGSTLYSSSEDSSSIISWPPDPPAWTPSTSASPIYPSLYPEEEEEEGEKGVDVGRSAFYLPPNQGDDSKRRDLLRIREGVKIYFIHTDGVITSPWKKPFLAVYRDPAKAQLLGDGLVVCVGNNLWTCELYKKATLVLRLQAGGYVFSEVAKKPECKAVCIRIPASVRRTQHEFLNKILQQNTLMEEERPKGFTKAISKGASSAATRMNKIVEDNFMSPNQPFVRRNSMRALKGVSKRLNTIAEKTGATMKELPKEYQVLQDAADTLTFARNAKMIQYI